MGEFTGRQCIAALALLAGSWALTAAAGDAYALRSTRPLFGNGEFNPSMRHTSEARAAIGFEHDCLPLFATDPAAAELPMDPAREGEAGAGGTPAPFESWLPDLGSNQGPAD